MRAIIENEPAIEPEIERMCAVMDTVPRFGEWSQYYPHDIVTVHLVAPIDGAHSIREDLVAAGDWGICLFTGGEGYLSIPWSNVAAIRTE